MCRWDHHITLSNVDQSLIRYSPCVHLVRTIAFVGPQVNIGRRDSVCTTVYNTYNYY